MTHQLSGKTVWNLTILSFFHFNALREKEILWNGCRVVSHLHTNDSLFGLLKKWKPSFLQQIAEFAKCERHHYEALKHWNTEWTTFYCYFLSHERNSMNLFLNRNFHQSISPVFISQYQCFLPCYLCGTFCPREHRIASCFCNQGKVCKYICS